MVQSLDQSIFLHEESENILMFFQHTTSRFPLALKEIYLKKDIYKWGCGMYVFFCYKETLPKALNSKICCEREITWWKDGKSSVTNKLFTAKVLTSLGINICNKELIHTNLTEMPQSYIYFSCHSLLQVQLDLDYKNFFAEFFIGIWYLLWVLGQNLIWTPKGVKILENLYISH